MNHGVLHVLSLALWGIGATIDQVEATVLAMRDSWQPKNAIAFVQETEGGDLSLCLDPDATAATNAATVLDSIRSRMEAAADRYESG